MLVDGKWQAAWQPVQAKDDAGRFIRQAARFRHWVTPDGAAGPSGAAGFAAASGRYHLYVARVCPWASRVLMVRALKRLDAVIPVVTLAPRLTDQGWCFAHDGMSSDPMTGARYLHELYTRADPGYSGRATVPVLWDSQRQTIVNNESADLVRMLGSAFDQFGDASIDLYPDEFRPEIDALNHQLYQRLNNGVYQAGFASSQAAYQEAVSGVFDMLARLEVRLADGRPYLFGDRLTESDVRLFVTLVRFDAAYYGLFKCNLRRLIDYRHLSAYTARLYRLPGIAATVDLDHIKAGYYSIKALNPTGIVPVGPAVIFPAAPGELS